MATTWISNVMKCGPLRKAKHGSKSGKKGYFVLKCDPQDPPNSACIFRFESESKMKQNKAPKEKVDLHTCFSINRLVDSRFPYCFAIYWPTNTWLLGCETEEECNQWHGSLREAWHLSHPQNPSLFQFEFCWDVVVQKDKGLTESKPELVGWYRLCVTELALFFHRVPEEKKGSAATQQDAGNKVMEFPFVYVSSYGHKGPVFWVKVGRSTVTGSGHLFMETDDPQTAASIHETIKNTIEENQQRPRSHSTVDPRRHSTAVRSSRERSVSTALAPVLSGGLVVSSPAAAGIGGPSARSRAISESERSLASGAALAYTNTSGGMGVLSAVPRKLARAFSECDGQPQHPMRPSETLLLALDYGSGVGATYGSSFRNQMPTGRLGPHKTGSSSSETLQLATGSSSAGAYVQPYMVGSPQPTHTVGGLPFWYKAGVPSMGLSPGAISTDSMGSSVGSGSGEWTSQAQLETPVASDTQEESYAMMTPLERGVSQDSVPDYTPMGPGHTTVGRSPKNVLAPGRQTSWNVDEVQSYIYGPGEIGNRSYSFGAGADAAALRKTSAHSSATPINLLQLGNVGAVQDDARKRAYSFGSWSKKKPTSKQLRNALKPIESSSQKSLNSSAGGLSGGEFRPRSDSTGSAISGGTSSGGTRFTRDDDLAEVDFDHIGGALVRSGSSSLGSSESVGRSRTNSAGSAAGYHWMPKIRQIKEQEQHQKMTLSPSKQFLLNNEVLGSDYMAMSPAQRTPPKVQPASNEGGDYLAMEPAKHGMVPVNGGAPPAPNRTLSEPMDDYYMMGPAPPIYTGNTKRSLHADTADSGYEDIGGEKSVDSGLAQMFITDPTAAVNVPSQDYENFNFNGPPTIRIDTGSGSMSTLKEEQESLLTPTEYANMSFFPATPTPCATSSGSSPISPVSSTWSGARTPTQPSPQHIRGSSGKDNAVKRCSSLTSPEFPATAGGQPRLRSPIMKGLFSGLNRKTSKEDRARTVSMVSCPPDPQQVVVSEPLTGRYRHSFCNLPAQVSPKVSVNEEPDVDYAQLDLRPATGVTPKTPTSLTPSVADNNSCNYAQIDLRRSEGLQRSHRRSAESSFR